MTIIIIFIIVLTMTKWTVKVRTSLKNTKKTFLIALSFIIIVKSIVIKIILLLIIIIIAITEILIIMITITIE